MKCNNPIDAIQSSYNRQDTDEFIVPHVVAGHTGINDGDVVVIKETNRAMNGDIVVALIEDQEATLKRFFVRGEAIALEAANPAYETRTFPHEKIKVQGRLVGLLRTY